MLIIVVITILPSIFELIGTALVSNVNDFWNNCYTSGVFRINWRGGKIKINQYL